MANSMGGYGGMQPRGGNAPKGYDLSQISNFTPQQQQLFKQMFSQVSPESNLARLAGGDESFFQQSEAPAMRQFNELLGGLSSRFSGMGDTGARRSSGFQNQSTAAASNFAQDLQARRQDLMSQARRDLSSMSNELLNQRPYEQFMTPKKPSFGEQILGVGLPLAGMFAGGAMGGVPGAYIGGQAGAAAGRAFF